MLSGPFPCPRVSRRMRASRASGSSGNEDSRRYDGEPTLGGSFGAVTAVPSGSSPDPFSTYQPWSPSRDIHDCRSATVETGLFPSSVLSIEKFVYLLLMYTQLPVGAGRLRSAETSAIRFVSSATPFGLPAWGAAN